MLGACSIKMTLPPPLGSPLPVWYKQVPKTNTAETTLALTSPLVEDKVKNQQDLK